MAGAFIRRLSNTKKILLERLCKPLKTQRDSVRFLIIHIVLTLRLRISTKMLIDRFAGWKKWQKKKSRSLGGFIAEE